MTPPPAEDAPLPRGDGPDKVTGRAVYRRHCPPRPRPRRGRAEHHRARPRDRRTHYDPRFDLPVDHELCDYHVPVALDVPRRDAFFVEADEPRELNPLGSKAVGEIATVGAAAAVANPVFHATGARVRDLPITPDRLLGGNA